MAPGFLSKLVTHSRTTSETEPRSRSPSARKRLPSTVGAPSSDQGSNSSRSRVPSLKFQLAEDSGRDASSSDINPNVTVIPPSPSTSSQNTLPPPSLHPDDERQEKDRHASSAQSAYYSASAQSSEDAATPTAATISHQRAATQPAQRSNLPPPLELRRQASDISLNASHSVPTTESALEESIYTNMSNISESPTEIRHPQPWSSQANEVERSSSLIPPRQDADTMSVKSAGGESSERRKRGWRRGSATSRKPTGLASALAASGLAMVNPALAAPPLPDQLSPPRRPRNSTQSATPRKSSIGSPPRAGRTSLDRRSTRSSEHETSHRRKGSVVHSADGGSDVFVDDPANYSGLEDSDEEDESESDDYLSDELGTHDIPVTGFAVASNKRNADFHEIFPTIPEGDYLIEDYGCALQREILIQGRIYISENHICFHANIFGWITDLSIPIYEVVSLEKKMTAFVIPNAIQITTRQSKYTFASFLARDTTFDVIYNIWKLSKPQDSLGLEGSQRPSLEDTPPDLRVVSEGGPLVRKATQCACGKAGQHLTEVPLETVLPGTPDRIYNLIFASGFIKDFMRDNQKLLDIQISDWTPTSPDSKLLTRNMSYIKPLNGSVGPKQTKCEIRDETIHCDFDDYVVTLTTTRTPDVPSGGVFSVKTRTCIMWASAISTKVIVTSQVEWTGRSFIKGIIERSCIEGQKVYHADLEKAMRAYIMEHQGEFIPAGVDLEEVAPASPSNVAETAVTAKEEPISDKKREQERNLRGLQWAWDTFEGASQVARQSTRGAIELLMDAWDQSSSTTILIFIIIFLVFSNLYSLMKMGSREEVGRRKEHRIVEDKEKWIHGVVSALWDELAAKRPGPSISTTPLVVDDDTPLGPLQEEVANLHNTLNTIEKRAQSMRASLDSLSKLD